MYNLSSICNEMCHIIVYFHNFSITRRIPKVSFRFFFLVSPILSHSSSISEKRLFVDVFAVSHVEILSKLVSFLVSLTISSSFSLISTFSIVLDSSKFFFFYIPRAFSRQLLLRSDPRNLGQGRCATIVYCTYNC